MAISDADILAAEPPDGSGDSSRITPLIAHLLPEAATAFQVDADVIVGAAESLA